MRAIPKTWLWLLLPCLAVSEVFAHGLIRARVPGERAWAEAAAFVREGFADGDALSAAPSWAGPIVREHLGDLIPLSMAGRSDLAAYRRLWTLSIRGHRPRELETVPLATLELTRRFGRVTVLRHRLPPPTVRYSFTEHLFEARVRRGGKRDQGGRPCPLRRTAAAGGGGLGKGVLAPARRFVCKRGSARGFVAPVVLEDLSLSPRHCVFQPALRGGPVRVTFPQVPLAEALVFYGGLYYEDERHGTGAPVHMRVFVDGQQRAQLRHRDGDGWSRMRVATTGGTADVTIEVDSRSGHKRGFCWAGSVRGQTP